MATPPTRSADLLRKLTPREAQTLTHLAAGHDLHRTAAALGVTPNTARSYLHRAMRKLGCPTEAAAIALIRTAPSAGPGKRPPAAHAPSPTSARAPDDAAPSADGGARPAAPGRAARGKQRSTRQRPAAPAPAPAAAPAPAPAAGGKPHPATGDDTATGPTRQPAARTGTAPEAGQSPAPHHDETPRPAPASSAPAAPAPTPRELAPAPAQAEPAEPAAPAAPGEHPEEAPSGTRRPAPSTPRERITTALTEASTARELSDDPGPAESFDELYEEAHTRLVQQVFLLTACRHRAVHCVRRAFGEARQEWAEVAASGNPEVWVRVRACELALSPWHRGGPRRAYAWKVPHRRIRVRPADESQAVLPDHDRLTDQDRTLLRALRRLSRPQRRALVLHDGLGMPATSVAVEVESTLTAAEGRVWAARAALAQWVPELVGPDPSAPEFADGLSGLLHRAAVRGCPEPHRAPVPVLRARHRLWTVSRTGAAALLTVAVGGAALATLAGARPAVLFRPPDPPVPVLCLPTPPPAPGPAAEADGPGVPLLPDGAPNGISSLWCSPAPGLEAVVADPQPRAAARWELPAVARGAAPPPPQGPVACPRWSPLPCTTGPTH